MSVHQDKPLFNLVVHFFTLFGQGCFQDARTRVLIQDVLYALNDKGLLGFRRDLSWVSEIFC